MKILIILFALVLCGYAQQVNYTWGYTTAGVAYTEAEQSMDSSDVLNIVFDMQDYSFMDMNPLSLDSVTVIGNSDALFLGTFWYRIDVNSASDTSAVLIEAFPGHMISHPNDGSRITTSNINFSTTATVLQDSSSHTANDIQWAGLNVYIDASIKELPPEFVKIKVSYSVATNDSIGFLWNFAYPALLESEQAQRKTTRTNNNARKVSKSLH